MGMMTAPFKARLAGWYQHTVDAVTAVRYRSFCKRTFHNEEAIAVTGVPKEACPFVKGAPTTPSWPTRAHMREEMAAKTPMGRVSEPREQAEVAAFLASDRSSFVTGPLIPVDGGWAARLAGATAGTPGVVRERVH
jgi:hypothetical protein